jgi:hypothetical protein
VVLGPGQPGGWQLDVAAPCAGPLQRAHAHNDQANGRPLADAVRHGFTSVEVDVWRVAGSLRIGHTRADAEALPSARNTLAVAYLGPLRRIVLRRAGTGRSVRTLLLDLKTQPARAVPLLRRELRDHRLGPGQETGSRLTVVLTSHLAGLAAAARGKPRLHLDHRFPDDGPVDLHGAGEPGDWISASWTRHFDWDGVGPMPTSEQRRLASLVAAAHRAGLRLRFWDTPSWPGARENVWAHLLRAGADRISTDDLAALEQFLRSHGDCARRAGPSAGSRQLARVREPPDPRRTRTQGFSVVAPTGFEPALPP